MLFSLIFLLFISFPFSSQIDIIISNINNTCSINCDGSPQNPFKTVYQAFYEISKSVEINVEFHFKIVASPQSYFIKENEIVDASPFEKFYGKIYIEPLILSPSPPFSPTLEWQTTSFYIKVNTFLNITGIILNGISVHVANHTKCVSEICCKEADLSKKEENNVCLLSDQTYNTFRTSGTKQKGLLNLGKGGFIFIFGTKVQNFYGVLNYQSFIYNNDEANTIYMNSVEFRSIYFLKGFIYFNPSGPLSLSFEVNNMQIINWNHLKVLVYFDEGKLFSKLEYYSFLFAFQFVFIQLKLSNINFINIYSDYIFSLTRSTLSIVNLQVGIFEGCFISLFEAETNLNISTAIFNNGKFGKKTSFILLEAASTEKITFINVNLKNSNGLVFNLLNAGNCTFQNILFQNISYGVYKEGTGSIFNIDGPYNYQIVNNAIFEDIRSCYNTLILQGHTDMFLLLNNSAFLKIDFADSYAFILMFSNMTLQNITFYSINCSKTIFSPSQYLGGGEHTSLLIKNSNFLLLIGKDVGPIAFMTRAHCLLKIEETLINGIISGLVTFVSSPLPNITYSFASVVFQNFYFKLGYMLILYEQNYFTCKRCVFEQFTFLDASTFIGILKVNDASLFFEDSVFRAVNIVKGDADLIYCRNSTISMFGGIIEKINFVGKGGIKFLKNCSALISNLHVSNLKSLDEGFFQFYDSFHIEISNSAFENIISSRYSLFLVYNFYSLVVKNCFFSKIGAILENSVFWITNQIMNTSLIFSKNVFKNNKAGYTGGCLVLNEIVSLIEFDGNEFSEGAANVASFFLISFVSMIKIDNSFFINGVANVEGGAMSIYESKVLMINCSFSNTTVLNGKGGGIYLENADLSLNNSIFSSINEMSEITVQGFALYCFFSKNSDFSLILFNVSFLSMFQSSEIIFISASFHLTILFDMIQCMNIHTIINLLMCAGCQGKISNLLLEGIHVEKGDLINIRCPSTMEINNLTLLSSSIQGNLLKLSLNQDFLLSNFSLEKNNISLFFIEISEAKKIEITNGILLTFQIGYNLFHSASDSLTISNLKLENGNLSTFSCSATNQIEIHNFSMQNINITLPNNELSAPKIKISNFWVHNSFVNQFLLDGEEIELLSVNYKNLMFIVQSVENELFSFGTQQTITCNSIILSSSNFFNTSGYFNIQNCKNITIMQLEYDYFNSNYFQSLVTISNHLSLIISSSKIKNLKNIRFLYAKSDYPNKIMINHSEFSNCGNSQAQSGGVFFIKSPNENSLIIKDCLFDSNYALVASILAYYTGSADSTVNLMNIVNLNNTAFFNFTCLIKSPPAFYSLFGTEHSLSFTSFANRIKVLLNSKEIVPKQAISIVLGEQIDLQFLAFDHFDNPIFTSENLQIELVAPLTSSIPSVSSFELKNNKGVFIGHECSLYGFNFESSPFSSFSSSSTSSSSSSSSSISNSTSSSTSSFPSLLPLEVEIRAYLRDEVGDRSDLGFGIRFLVGDCKEGFKLVDNKCSKCGEGTYSLDAQPSNLTICHSCPQNSYCRDGKYIYPTSGFWNSDSSTDKILRCVNNVACNMAESLKNLPTANFKSICLNGYFGNVCDECADNFGKNMLNSCKPCDENQYFSLHLMRTIFKYFALSIFILFQFYYWTSFDVKEDKIILNAINILVYHLTLLSFVIKFKYMPQREIEVFFEIESVFSFFENNLFLVYCIFPKTRNFNLYIIIFLYIFVMMILEFVFSLILILLFKNFGSRTSFSKSTNKKNITFIICLIIWNNFPNFCYYFFGLVVPLKLDENSTVSVYFKQILIGSSDHYTIIFTVAFVLLLIFLLNMLFLAKREGFSLFLQKIDCKYIKYFEFVNIIHYLSLLSIIFLSHFSITNPDLAFFAQNIYMLYSGWILAFKINSDLMAKVLRLSSFILIFLSFYDNLFIVIVLNSVYFIGILGWVGLWILKKNEEETIQEL